MVAPMAAALLFSVNAGRDICFGSKADVARTRGYFRYVPRTDIDAPMPLRFARRSKAEDVPQFGAEAPRFMTVDLADDINRKRKPEPTGRALIQRT
jgi:hypothetical protein